MSADQGPFGRQALVRAGLDERRALLKATASLSGLVAEIADIVSEALGSGGKVLVFGNGGSAADAQHFAAELVGRYKREREGLAAISLATDTSAMTAIANDYGYEYVFARQVEALGRAGDVAIGLTTSGRSPNVVRGIEAAMRKQMWVVTLAGAAPSPLDAIPGLHVRIPSTDTPLVQEAHGVLLHLSAELIDSGPGLPTRAVVSATERMEFGQLATMRESWARAGLKVVSTNGCFDVLHRGHVSSLAAARALGDVLIVGLNSDASVRRLKGSPRPIYPYEDRRVILSALRDVAAVVQIEDDPCEFLRLLRPDVHCKGEEYRAAVATAMPERVVVEEGGGAIVYLPLVEGVSTSAVVERMRTM